MTFLLLALALSARAPLTPPPPPAATIAGTVTGPDSAPLSGARVSLVETGRITTTDADGHYRFVGVARGSYGLSFAMVGYAPKVFRVRMEDADVTVNVSLVPSLVELPDVQVTASPLATTAHNSPQPTAVLSAADLMASGAPSLGETASVLPGVRSVSTGAGIGKPVIRGLTSNRVLVLDDGQRLETAQWGDEHGPNIETADAARIEVIRGPASVLYGSDALGGVINVVARPLPDALGKPSFVGGRAEASYASNNRMPAGTLALEGASGGFGFNVSGTARGGDDVRTPDGPLPNSGLRTITGEGSAGWRGSWGSTRLTVSHRDERLEIHEDPAEEPDATPFQRIGEDRMHLEATLPVGESHLDVSAGYERNNRREFEEDGATEVALGLRTQSWTGDVRLHHPALGPFAGIIGLSGERTSLGTYGEEALVPANQVVNGALYVSEQASAGRWELSVGARGDLRHLDVDADDRIGVVAQARNFSAVSGSLGALLHTTSQTALVLNVGRGFRAPSAFELFANGVHEGTVRFERGDSTLANEHALNTDLAFRVASNRVSAELGGFVNLIDNYIYPEPTAFTDPESGFPVYQYTQGNARLMGFEAVGEYHPAAWLHFRGTADYVRGQNTDLGEPLPFVPPLRATYAVRLEGSRVGSVEGLYFAVQGETNARQTRLAPNDTAPAGATLVHLGAGGGTVLGGRTFTLDIQVRNLFDTRYTSFLSRYKLYAPDPGRNIIVRVSSSF
jgi:iron complex outermembrane receptor protein